MTRPKPACAARSSLDPTNSAANLNLGMLLAEMGKMPEAEQAFRAAFKADPKSAQAAYNLGVLLSKDHPKEALTWCRRAAELRPENPQYGYTYAFYLYRAGQLDEALKVIRAVRQRHPDARRQPAARTPTAAGAGNRSAPAARAAERIENLAPASLAAAGKDARAAGRHGWPSTINHQLLHDPACPSAPSRTYAAGRSVPPHPTQVGAGPICGYFSLSS